MNFCIKLRLTWLTPYELIGFNFKKTAPHFGGGAQRQSQPLHALQGFWILERTTEVWRDDVVAEKESTAPAIAPAPEQLRKKKQVLWKDAFKM